MVIKFFAFFSALVFLYAGYFVSKVLSVLDLKKTLIFQKGGRKVVEIHTMQLFIFVVFSVIWAFLMLSFALKP